MPGNIDKNVQKEAIKEALQEWLDKKYADIEREFGRWSMRALLAGAFAGAVYLALVGAGWHK